MPDPAEKLAQPTSADASSMRARARPHQPEWTPFVRMEQALHAATPERTTLPMPDLDISDHFRERLEHRRLHAAPVALHDDSDALRDMYRRERIYRRMLAVADAIATATSLLFAIAVLGGYAMRPLYLLVVPFVILAAKLGGLYDRDDRVLDHSTINELPRLLNVATIFALLVWLGRHYVVVGSPTTADLLTMWVLLTASLIVARVIARRISGLLSPVERCMVIGRPGVFERIELKLRGHRRVELVSRADAADIAHDHALLARVAERDRVHRVIIDTDAAELRRYARDRAPRQRERPAGEPAAVDARRGWQCGRVRRHRRPRADGRPSLRPQPIVAGPQTRVRPRRARRSSSCCRAPVMALIAIAIKLDSRGPVLFRQTRMGRNDRPFRMLKFRSMVDGADALKDGLRDAQRGARRALQDRRRSADHARRALAAPDAASMSCRSSSTCSAGA